MPESTSTGFDDQTQGPDVPRKSSGWISGLGLGAFFWSMKAIISEAQLNNIFAFETIIWMMAWLGQPTDSGIWWTIRILSNSEQIYASMSLFVWMWFWSRSKIQRQVRSSFNHLTMCPPLRLVMKKYRGRLYRPIAPLIALQKAHCSSVPSHSSSPSMTIRIGYLKVLPSSDAWMIGFIINLSICVSTSFWNVDRSSSTAFAMNSLSSGIETQSWYASVAIRFLSVFLSELKREKKKDAPSILFVLQYSAIVWAMADFPVPSEPKR